MTLLTLIDQLTERFPLNTKALTLRRADSLVAGRLEFTSLLVLSPRVYCLLDQFHQTSATHFPQGRRNDPALLDQ